MSCRSLHVVATDSLFRAAFADLAGPARAAFKVPPPPPFLGRGDARRGPERGVLVPDSPCSRALAPLPAGCNGARPHLVPGRDRPVRPDHGPLRRRPCRRAVRPPTEHRLHATLSPTTVKTKPLQHHVDRPLTNQPASDEPTGRMTLPGSSRRSCPAAPSPRASPCASFPTAPVPLQGPRRSASPQRRRALSRPWSH